MRDGGPGLSDDDLTVAFERSALYERYRGIRQVGTGLGLAIVHRIVDRLGGTVEAGHAVEGGARFTIRMPLLTPTALAPPTPGAWTGATPAGPGASPGSVRSLHVLASTGTRTHP